MTVILNGKQFANIILNEVKSEVAQLKAKHCMVPKLVVIQVGNDKASTVYVRNKHRACENTSILSEQMSLQETTSEQELLEIIKKLNLDNTVSGLIVQLPLPKHIDENQILDAISPMKDVDGFHPNNIGKLAQSRPLFRSCTPYGIMLLLEHYDIELTGKNVLVVGASNIVGRPMVLEALNHGATITCANSKTKNLKAHCKNADVVIMATGKRGLLEAKDFNEHAVVIDVGIHKLDDGSLCGDLDFTTISEKVAYMTPVPGGVGPLTVACLLKNTLQAFKQQQNR